MALTVQCGLRGQAVNASGSGSQYRLFAHCIVLVLEAMYAFQTSLVHLIVGSAKRPAGDALAGDSHSKPAIVLTPRAYCIQPR